MLKRLTAKIVPSYPTVTSGSAFITSQFYLPPPSQPKLELKLNGKVHKAEDDQALSVVQPAGDSGATSVNLTSMSSLKHLKKSLNANMSRSMHNLREVEVITGKVVSDPPPLEKENRSSSMDVGKSLRQEELAKLRKASKTFIDDQAIKSEALEKRKSHTLPSQLSPTDLECFVSGPRPGIGHFHLSRHLKKSVSLLPNPVRGLTSVLSSRGQQQKTIHVTRYFVNVAESTCVVLTFRVRSGKGCSPHNKKNVQRL